MALLDNSPNARKAWLIVVIILFLLALAALVWSLVATNYDWAQLQSGTIYSAWFWTGLIGAIVFLCIGIGLAYKM